ncbi:uncharacterized protein LOC111946776 [Oryzias latipes]
MVLRQPASLNAVPGAHLKSHLQLHTLILHFPGILQDDDGNQIPRELLIMSKIILKQLVKAAKKLEEKEIFHHDIKMENILIETSTTCVPCICQLHPVILLSHRLQGSPGCTLGCRLFMLTLHKAHTTPSLDPLVYPEVVTETPGHVTHRLTLMGFLCTKQTVSLSGLFILFMFLQNNVKLLLD